MRKSFRSSTWIGLVLLCILCCLDARVARATTVNASPAVLSFCVAANNDIAPPTQGFVLLTNDGSDLLYQATSNQSWLLIQNSTTNPTDQVYGTTQSSGTVTVSIDPSAYASANAASGTIAVVVNGGTTNVNVSVTVNSTCPAGAGDGTFTSDKKSLTFSDSSLTQTVNVTSTAGGDVSAGVVLVTHVGFQWIQFQPVGEVTLPQAYTVTVASLPAGTYKGHLIVGSGSNPGAYLDIPVTYTAGSSSTVTLTPSPSTLAFTIAAGATTTQTKNLTVLSTSSVHISANATMDTGSGWLSVGTISGSSIFTVPVNVNPTGLAGTYTGHIFVQDTSNSANAINVPVTVTVGSGLPALTFSPQQLSFGYQVGGSTPASQTLNVSSPAGTSVAFASAASSSTCGGNWLVVTPTQSSTGTTNPAPISVQISTTGLTTNATCTGNIQVTSSAASNTSTNIPVTLTVSTSPQIGASVNALSFTSSSGAQPAAQSFNVTSTGSTLNYTVTISPATNGQPIFINPPASGSTGSTSSSSPSSLSVGIDPSVLGQLSAGVYTDDIVITSAGASNTAGVTIPVTLTISNVGTLTTNPTSIGTNYQIGQSQPLDQIIKVFSTASNLQFTASAAYSTCGSFFALNPGAGTTMTASAAGTDLDVQFTLGGVTQTGTCTGTISLTLAGSTTPAATVQVTVQVVGPAAINVGPPTSVTLSTVTNAAPTSIPVPITSTDGVSHLDFTASVSTSATGQVWLSASPQTGITPANLQVQFNPVNLPAGTYTGSIKITSVSSSVPAQTVPVTMIVAALPSISPTSLTFTALQNGSSPASNTITVNNVASGATVSASASASSGLSWLSAAVSGNAVSVSANSAGLNPGSYSGTVTIAVSGAANSPFTVPVTLTVSPSAALALSSSSVSFNALVGATTSPANQTVQLSAGAATAVPFTVTATSQSNFLTVTPTSGSTLPATLTVGVSQSVLSSLAAGTYTGTVTVSSPNATSTATANVTLTVVGIPVPSITTVLSAATLSSGSVSPGELVAIQGTNLGPATPLEMTITQSGTVPTTLGNIQVFFDTYAAPLLYVSPTQINAIVPYEVAGRVQTSVTVINNGITSAAMAYHVADAAPGVFTSDASGGGQAAIANQNGTINGVNAPAPKGSVIAIYATGEGMLNTANGGTTASLTPWVPPFPQPKLPVTVTFLVSHPNGIVTLEQGSVQYAGEAPSLVSGVLQVNVVVPSDVLSGSVTFYISVGTYNSQQVSVYVQ